MLLILLNIKQELAKRNAKQCDQKIDKNIAQFLKKWPKNVQYIYIEPHLKP
jgi:hypothetical protein